MDAVKEMNGIIWVFALIIVGFACVQAMLFVRHALKFNNEHQLLSQSDLRQCVKTGLLSTIGPSVSVIFVALALISLLGPALTFLRTGVIGSPSYELTIATIASSVIGKDLATDALTYSEFTFIIWSLEFAVLGFLISTIITMKPLDKVSSAPQAKSGKPSFGSYAAMTAGVGCLVYITINDFLTSIPNYSAFVAGFIGCAILTWVAKKPGAKWVYSWIMAFAMILGMIAGQVAAGI